MEEPKAIIDESHTPLDHAHWPLSGGKHPLRPGYYHYDGQLARRRKLAGIPQVWNGREWEMGELRRPLQVRSRRRPHH